MKYYPAVMEQFYIYTDKNILSREKAKGRTLAGQYTTIYIQIFNLKYLWKYMQKTNNCVYIGKLDRCGKILCS